MLATREGMQPEILKINPQEPEGPLVSYAAEQLKMGNLLALPTDTFYGLAVDPYNLRAVEKVYKVKERGRHKPLSLLIESIEMGEQLSAPLPDEFYLLAERFWPGPLTIIVKAAPRLPLKVTANTGNIALRFPENKIALSIVRAAGVPVTATAASLSGHPDCTSADQVRDQLKDQVPLIVDGGKSGRDVPSTIVYLADRGGWKLMREGAIPVQEIEDFLGDQ